MLDAMKLVGCSQFAEQSISKRNEQICARRNGFEEHSIDLVQVFKHTDDFHLFASWRDWNVYAVDKLLVDSRHRCSRCMPRNP